MLIPRYIGLRVYLKGPMIASFEACEGCIGLIVVSSCLKTLAAEIKTDRPQIIITIPSGIWYSKLKGSISLFEKAIKKIKIRVTIGGGIFVSIKKLYQSESKLLLRDCNVHPAPPPLDAAEAASSSNCWLSDEIEEINVTPLPRLAVTPFTLSFLVRSISTSV